MQTFKNQKFDGRSFDMDETVFYGCKLTDCDLYFSGGDVEWVDTHFENCRWHWRGGAKNTFGLLHVLGLLNPQVVPQMPKSAGPKAN
jgi:hypothetical protein